MSSSSIRHHYHHQYHFIFFNSDNVAYNTMDTTTLGNTQKNKQTRYWGSYRILQSLLNYFNKQEAQLLLGDRATRKYAKDS